MATIRDLFTVERARDILILSPRGDIAGFLDQDVQRQVAEIEQEIETGEAKHILVDLGGSRYFGSVVIGVINSLARFVRERQGVLVLSDVSDDMSQVLRVMKLDDSLPQFDTRKAAQKYLKNVEPSGIG